jgi:uncharacterized protein (TIGR03435 family)
MFCLKAEDKMTTSSTIRNRRPSVRARTGCIAVVALMALAPAARAQAPAPTPAPAPASDTHAKGDISGQWQGTLEPPNNKTLRTIIVISKGEKGLAARAYSIDRGAQGFNAQSVTRDGNSVKIDLSIIAVSFTGTLAADGNSITGTWTEGDKPLPFTLLRSNKDTAWEIPPPPTPPKLMAADADPSFDVATIKPNNSGANSMQQFTVGGRNFTVRAGSLADLIGFVYGVQPRQIVNGPDWMNSDRYDISATIQPEGAPNPEQVRIMLRKLLADRFALKIHNDKRDMPAYVLSIAKSGQKLTPTQLSGPLPGFGMRPSANPSGVTLMARNAGFDEFRTFLQTLVLDRPVVDHTDLTGKYDFQLTFTPDDSQFNGHAPKAPASPDSGAPPVEPAPDLFKAFSDQLGLKLEAQKTAVDVIAIDHVDKPSPN